ncbi:uracil-DNA glycosylase [Acidothermaceae bacterium B102]|nr:uracil-DNA glycosylase [Acidothermaceae bacterium B102]
MTHAFCPGYPPPYDALVTDYPGDDIYPPAAFRVEWGPIFHRGRLDGSARLLVVGQDPATEEDVARRILVGVAGQRTQGLMTKLGITRSYVMVNTFLYSVAGQSGGTQHQHDQGIIDYRHRWLDLLATNNSFDAVITLGTLAASAYATWSATPTGAAHQPHLAQLIHPTYPESASASGSGTLAQDMKKLLDNWNSGLPALAAALTHPDQPQDTTPYGATFTPADLTPIPDMDLPPGLPEWMHSPGVWARRTGTTPNDKRATLTVVVPADQRAWV